MERLRPALVLLLTRPFDADLIDVRAPGSAVRLRFFALGRGQDGARAWLTSRGLTWFLAAPGDRPPSAVMQPFGSRDGARIVLAHSREQLDVIVPS